MLVLRLLGKRWFIVWAGLFFAGIVAKYALTFDFLPQGQPLRLGDYWFSSLSNPLVMLLLIPSIYCYFMHDLYMEDKEGDYITYIFPRLSHRMQYVGDKYITIICLAALFALSVALIFFLVGLLFRLPWQGPLYFQVVTGVGEITWGQLLQLLLIQMSLLWVWLMTLGLLLFTSSLFIPHTLACYGIILALIVQSHQTVFHTHTGLFITPLAQGMLAFHAPYYFYRLSTDQHTTSMDAMQSFTVTYSLIYLLVMSSVLVVLCYWRMRTLNIGRRSRI